MRHLSALVLLAGCASAIPFDDPCACVIIPEINGAISLAMFGAALTFDDDISPTESMPVTGNLFGVAVGGASANFLDIEGMDGVSLSASWGNTTSFDMAAPAALTDLYFQTSARADTEFAESAAYDLGPQGGTLRLREIVADPDGGYRVRGGFSGQVCNSDAVDDCTTLTGNFAFDAPTLPANGNATTLIAGG